MPVRRLLLLSLALLTLLAGCTRSRATPQPEPAADIAEPAVMTNTVASGGEPLVEFNPSSAAADTAAATATPAPTVTRATINYTVEEGDTLSSVALKFGVEMERVRQLNRLLDDNLYVGQILQMPYTEGVTAEGLPTPTPEPYVHVVAEGNNLGIIADSYGVSEVAIMEANGLSDPNSLYVGQPLIIPGYGVTAPAPAPAAEGNTTGSETATTATTTTGDAVTHVVQPGDTLYGISEVYNVEAATIMSANNIVNGNQLRVGQQLTIPGISVLEAAAARGRVHVIQSGESLISIANGYGVTPEEITEINGINDPNTIYVGQQLIIPGQ